MPIFAGQLILLILSIFPLLYVVYRVRGKSFSDTAAFAYLVLLFIILNRRFVFGSQFVFHDVMWCYHVFYTIIDQWLRSGVSIGWNPFMNGGEPLFIYSNYFLWAELVVFSIVNRLFNIPYHALANLVFTFILLSYFTFSFVFFSLVFKKRSLVLFPVVVLMFGGMAFLNRGQFFLSISQLFPLVFATLYLFIRKKNAIFLLWAFFFLCVSSNHYMPYYLFIFIVLFSLSYLVLWALFYRKEEKLNFSFASSKKYIAPVLLISIMTLLPAVKAFHEFKDYVSPTRGGAELAERLTGVQGSAGVKPSAYRFLLLPVPANPYLATWKNLEYCHSPYFIGPIALVFFLLSFFRNKDHFYWSSALALVFMAYLAHHGNPVWAFLRTRVPFFYARHYYAFSDYICFLMILMATFGLRNFIRGDKPRYLITFFTFLLLAYYHVIAASYANDAPYELESIIYPKRREMYSRRITPVPFDTSPLIFKEAAATHPSDDFIFFRKPSYDRLLKTSPEYVIGDIFVFVPDKLSGDSRNIKVEYLEDKDPNHLRLRADVTEDGYLIRKENFHPGWKADVNSEKIPVIETDKGFQAIKVRKGTAVVDLRFASSYPAFFWLHTIFTFAGYVIFFVYLVKTLEKDER